MNFESLTAKDLQAQCKLRKLSISGNKSDLIARLKKHELNEQNTPKLIKENTLENQPTADSRITIQATYPFIHLHASNLLYFFNYGVIYPLALEESLIYKNENREFDTFTLVEEYILLKEEISFKNHSDQDVFVEIVTDSIPLAFIAEHNVFCCAQPIPISRVRAIYFNSVESLKSFIASSKTYPDCYIPEDLCKVADGSTNMVKQNSELGKLNLRPNLDLEKWKLRLSKFDKLMGLVSFIKNGGIFFADQENFFQEYTPTYISLISSINQTYLTEDKKGTSHYRFMLFPEEMEIRSLQRELFRQILDKIYTNQEFSFRSSIILLEQLVSLQHANLEDKKELNSVIALLQGLSSYQLVFDDVIRRPELKNNFPLLALLFLSKYSNRGKTHTDKQAVRNVFIRNEAELSKPVVEFLLAILGLYYGYNTMVKSDTNLNFKDRVFSQIAEEVQSIKFKLDTYFDRFIIESLFIVAQTGKPALDKFQYLALVTKHSAINIRSLILDKTQGYVDVSERIFDKQNIAIKKVSRKEKALALIDEIYPEKISSKSTLLHFLLENIGVPKKMLIDLFKSSVEENDIDDIDNLIRIDKKNRLNR